MSKLKRIKYISCLILLFLFVSADLWAQKINDVSLQTLDGKALKIAKFNKKLLVVVFLSPECPLSQNYTLTLNKLFEKYKMDIDLVGVFPGKSYTSSDYHLFNKKYNIQFTLLADTLKNIVKNLAAKATPEVFLLDKQRVIKYHGAIDNWAVSLGKQRNKSTQNYLEDAIASVLNNQPVLVKETKPVGCLINDL